MKKSAFPKLLALLAFLGTVYCAQPASADPLCYTFPQSVQCTFTLTGTGKTWTVPSNWSATNTVICIGSGGNGAVGSGGTSGGGGGGSSNEAQASNITLTPGATINYQVGTAGGGNSSTGIGSTWFNGTGATSASCGYSGGGNGGGGATFFSGIAGGAGVGGGGGGAPGGYAGYPGTSTAGGAGAANGWSGGQGGAGATSSTAADSGGNGGDLGIAGGTGGGGGGGAPTTNLNGANAGTYGAGGGGAFHGGTAGNGANGSHYRDVAAEQLDEAATQMHDLDVYDWLQKRADMSRRIRASVLGRKNWTVHQVAAVATHVSAYVADRTGCALVEIEQMTDAEFLSVAKPLLDFLDARWF